MKISIQHAIRAALLLGGIVAAGAAQADASFAVTLQDRSPEVPTARVRISLALASAPVSGTTKITVNGVDAVLDGPPVNPGGDTLRLLSYPSLSNGVTVLYEPTSTLGADTCSPATGFPTINFAFTGPAISSYAITSYGAPGPTQSQSNDCTQAKRRLATNAALIAWQGTAPTALDRNPLDVILVLDKSGSMALPPPGEPTSSQTRWDALTSAFGQFEGLWEQNGGNLISGDRLGLVFFDSTATPASFGSSASIFVPRGTNPPGSTHNWQQVVSTVDAQGPGSNTAIGLGVQSAIDHWKADPANDANIVLMTDGEQNTAPLISQITGTSDWGLVDPPSTTPVKLSSYGIPMQTIGFGIPGQVQQDLLDGIAAQTAGQSILTATGSGLSTSMLDALMSSLKGNTLSLLDRTTASVAQGQKFASVKVLIDQSVSRASFVLSSASGGRRPFQLTLVAPNGTTVTPVAMRQGEGWIVASVDVPATGPIGEWTAQVVPGDVAAAPEFTLSTYGEDRRLKYKLALASATTGTGDPLVLTAEVGYDGKPLKNIPGGIKVSLAKPDAGLGTLLSQDTNAPKPASSGDQQSPYSAKLAALLAQGGLLDKVTPKSQGGGDALRDDGSNGDAFANDGVYSNTFVDTKVPGTHRLDLAIDWDDPRTGKVHRIESIEREVQVTPDPASSKVEVLATAPAGTTTIRVTPIDHFGNVLGPGYDGRLGVSFSGGSGKLIGVNDPNVTGAYELQLGDLTPGTSVIVTVGGKPTSNPVLVGGGGGGGLLGKLPWWLWLLLVLIVLLILFLRGKL